MGVTGEGVIDSETAVHTSPPTSLRVYRPWGANLECVAALAVAAKYAITGYDAQYVARAQSLNAPLITEDRRLRKAVRGIAFSMQEFLAE